MPDVKIQWLPLLSNKNKQGGGVVDFANKSFDRKKITVLEKYIFTC